MMMTGATPSHPNEPQMQPIYGVNPNREDQPSSSTSLEANSLDPPQSTHPSSFLYNLSVLKDQVNQVQSLATIFMSPESTAVAVPTLGTLIQEINVTASSMMFACQQMTLSSAVTNNSNNNNTSNTFELQQQQNRANEGVDEGSLLAQQGRIEERGPVRFYQDHHDTIDQWYSENYNISNNQNNDTNMHISTTFGVSNSDEGCGKDYWLDKTETSDWSKRAKSGLGKNSSSLSQGVVSPDNYDIIELNAADLLANYTHYCQVCGKGFKRDANLRMHMRAHGDEYKSSTALSNPMKNSSSTTDSSGGMRKYSCPQEGCRWNQNHVKFQPLKSMICVKNHYKRSHCPKMYVCNRCNRKQFSILSDLRTHEKHCGDLKWQCSCGTTFSRKDKLMGHVALFVGHSPTMMKMGSAGALQSGDQQMLLDERR